MVLYQETAHTFPETDLLLSSFLRHSFPLPYIVLAHNQRYPSPYGLHILSSDVIDRSFLPSNPNILRTTRLILKKGKVPRWAPGVLQKVGTSWVLEVTDVEYGLVGPGREPLEGKGEGDETGGKLVERELRTRSRNIDRVEFMEVMEWQRFTEGKEDKLSTDVTTLSRVSSEFGFWPLPQRIEAYGVSKLPKSIEGARLGITLLAELLLRPSTSSTILSSGPLKPFPFDPVPSQFTLAMRAKLDEARLALATARERGEVLPGELGKAGEGQEGEEPRGLRAWREMWRAAVVRNKRRFREKVCVVTGLMCDEPVEPPR
ncbi:hypothetical protein JCM8547_002080 [Rhodosporidiobolus lusitaniae]